MPLFFVTHHGSVYNLGTQWLLFYDVASVDHDYFRASGVANGYLDQNFPFHTLITVY